MKALQFDSGQLTVTGAQADVFTIRNTAGKDIWDIEVKNQATSTHALTQFAVWLKASADADWVKYIEDAGFIAVNTNIRWYSGPAGGPHLLAAGEVARIQLRTNGAYAMKFRATSAGTTLLRFKGSGINE